MAAVTLNSNAYENADFVGADGRGWTSIFPATGLQLFPESIFTDMLAELASAVTIEGLSPGAAGGILVSDGAAWKRAASATITDAGAAVFASVSTATLTATSSITVAQGTMNVGDSTLSTPLATFQLYDNTAADNATIRLQTSNHNTWQTHGALGNLDYFGSVEFAGSDGTGWFVGAAIKAIAIEGWATGTDGGADLEFWTTPKNGVTLTKGATLDDTGQWILHAGPLVVEDTGTSTFAGDISVAGTGPHAIGGAALDNAQLILRGNFTSGGVNNFATKLYMSGALTGAVGDTDFLTGSYFINTIVTQGTDTNITVVSQAYFVEPGITNNLASSGKPDVAATVYIKNAPTEGDANAALYVAAGATMLPFANTVAGTGLMVTTNNSSVQEIMRDSSSARFKKGVKDAVIDPRAVLSLMPKDYGRHGQAGRFTGFIAEDFDKAGFGNILDHDDDGPVGFLEFGRPITALQQTVLQWHDTRIEALETALAAYGKAA